MESLPALLSLVENRSVGRYDEKMPLENLTLTSTHLDTEIRSIWMPILAKERFMAHGLFLMDTFFDSGGEVDGFILQTDEMQSLYEYCHGSCSRMVGMFVGM